MTEATTAPEPRVGTTSLGNLKVSRLGLGCMVLTRSYAAVEETESAATLDLALELGVNFLDTADAYGAGENESFLGHYLGSRRDKIVLASKFGLVAGADGIAIDGRPAHVKAACEQSLRRLKVDHLDLYYQHRVDPRVPLAETVGAMGELVRAGLVRHLGMCELSADQLRSAHAEHPITVLQSEWSLWARQIEAEVVGEARRLGVGIVPYSPLGRGFLAGAIRKDGTLAAGDLRGDDPRLHGQHLEHNLALLGVLEDIAADRDATPAQVALAWLLAQGDDVVPIPGVERRDLLRQNLGALDVELAPDDLARLDSSFAPGATSGNPDATLLRR